MGDINFDLSTSKIFTGLTYGCAAIGAAVGVNMTAATSTLGLIGAGAAGAVAGGLGIPVAVTCAAVVGYAAYVGIKGAAKALKKEGAMLPFGAVIIGFSAAKALFVNPFKGLSALCKKLAPSKKDTPPQNPPAGTGTDTSADVATPPLTRFPDSSLAASFPTPGSTPATPPQGKGPATPPPLPPAPGA